MSMVIFLLLHEKLQAELTKYLKLLSDHATLLGISKYGLHRKVYKNKKFVLLY